MREGTVERVDILACHGAEKVGMPRPHVVVGELAHERAESGLRYVDLAVTGGEPLVHPAETIAFFEVARGLFPQAYTRLYTSGSGLTPALLAQLEAAGLSEIRFSVKTDDPPELIDHVFGQMAAARERIGSVMVEMPVMPDSRAQMEELLARMDETGIAGVNLLELCFPWHNATEFARRGYRVRSRPYRVLYNYLYAGGLPVDGSEAACVGLLEFALDAGLSLGVHYCSLENKFTGQVYQQNKHIRGVTRPWHTMSERDWFWKSAKVFGDDCATAEFALRSSGEVRFDRDAESDSLEFPVAAISALARTMPDAEVAVCLAIAERRDDGDVLRELALQRTSPATFDLATDI